ncbi:3-deoxy-8-phosphooctulonate synthase [Desulfonatronospira sp.]|uniref:3-deoxy-8-phosphooctulonate synthase n=1 Tax=Desulfonatronospira sp. TaxID=1962951 RepID=UPI0025BE57C3|nr:3-deoxy-8-phosphooctulonate synthase [Desulfonatronospira sp.]
MTTNPDAMKDVFESSKHELFFILGPCVMESRDMSLHVARSLAGMAQSLGVNIVFKSSFDKANRSSIQGFRGPGLKQGLEWLQEVKSRTGLPLISDIHTPQQADEVARVVDVIQIPALLCRQTDLILAAAATGRIVNIKKGQFMAPWDMAGVVEKAASQNSRLWITERGTTFGYNNLVVDFKSIPIMSGLGFPVILDATHSVQLPGGLKTSSGGQRRFVPALARAGVAAGAQGIFMEVHPHPDQALCDGPNSWPLDDTFALLKNLLQIRDALHA